MSKEKNKQKETSKKAPEKSLKEKFKVLDGQFEGNESIVLNDVPVEFGQKKKYTQRYATIQNS